MGKEPKSRRHACPQCDYKTGDVSNLNKHVRVVHEKRKDHTCPQCDAAFGEASTLKAHVRAVHEKRRDHACPQCDAAFGRASNLKAHVRAVHEKRRDHTCPQCDAAFGEASNLSRHVHTVHNTALIAAREATQKAREAAKADGMSAKQRERRTLKAQMLVGLAQMDKQLRQWAQQNSCATAVLLRSLPPIVPGQRIKGMQRESIFEQIARLPITDGDRQPPLDSF